MSTTSTAKRQHTINAARRCHECPEEALGRCPDCHNSFCQEHFPKQQHSPCAEKQMKLAQTQVCYVCSAQVYPDQWSTSRTSHYIDQFQCKGCGRHVCDELHTQRKIDDARATLNNPSATPAQKQAATMERVNAIQASSTALSVARATQINQDARAQFLDMSRH